METIEVSGDAHSCWGSLVVRAHIYLSFLKQWRRKRRERNMQLFLQYGCKGLILCLELKCEVKHWWTGDSSTFLSPLHLLCYITPEDLYLSSFLSLFLVLFPSLSLWNYTSFADPTLIDGHKAARDTPYEGWQNALICTANVRFGSSEDWTLPTGHLTWQPHMQRYWW